MKTLRTQRKRSAALPLIVIILTLLIIMGCLIWNEFGFITFVSDNTSAAPVPVTPLSQSSRIDDPYFPVRISPELESVFSVVYDLSSDFYLFEKNADARCYPASLTKLMTAAVALETVPKDTVFTVGDEISLVGYNSSIAWLAKGQKISLQGLISALLLPSGNDAAYVIATGVGRSILDDPNAKPMYAVKAFCERMNTRLAEISAISTHFTNPDGYHDDEHYTTARDLLTITKFALGFDEIRNVCSQHKMRVLFKSGQDVTYTNSNLLLNENSSFYCKYAKGIKTGTTSYAGNCLISLFEKDGREVIAVNLGAPDSAGRYRDAVKIFDMVYAS